MQNRRADALLAYAIAERAASFPHREASSSRRVVIAEQAAVQLGVSKADIKERWSRKGNSENSPLGLLDDKIISPLAVKACLDDEHRRLQHDYDGTIHLQQNRARASYLGGRAMHGLQLSLFERQSTMIAPESFDPMTPWPLECDRLFVMANVHRGRLLAYECDMLNVINANSDMDLPRPLSLSKIDCFTCTDLPWLIKMLKACLQAFEIGYSEVVNAQGCWFVARYSFIQQKIVTTHYFSISLFRHPLRSGHFGVDVCSDEGMCSARLIQSDYQHSKGVHYSEPKRLRKIIRQYLEAAKGQQANAAAPPVPPNKPAAGGTGGSQMEKAVYR